MLQLRDKFIPKTKANQQDWRKKGSIPISKSLRKAIKNKHAAHRSWILKKNALNGDEARMQFKNQRNKVKRLLRKAKREFEKNVASKVKQNPKSFWNHVRQKLKSKPGVAPLLQNPKDKSSVKFTDQEKANILQNQFSSV